MKKLLFAFLSMTFLFASCAKDGKDGAVGPQGPAGNANVSSTTINVAATDWVTQGSGPTHRWYSAYLSVPSITQAVLDRGLVMVYWNLWTTEYVPLPHLISPPNWSDARQWTPFHYLGGVRIESVHPDHTRSVRPDAAKFKVVVIPAGLRKMPKVDWNNYAEVAKTFNLPD
jgi:hypothetical protein